ncbi:MAG TPA: GNAT family N-acetyltransferase [Elusimicrobiota bacterium]|nr:GNAT family N-acetyltransferase [Elusimicrobiota bacterium]
MRKAASPAKIRRLRKTDFKDAAKLAGQLGYPSTRAAVAKRSSIIAKLPGHAVFVAESSGGRVVGWIHVFPFPILEAEPRMALGGLVVDEAWRGRGIGKLLLAAAEAWSLKRGYSWLRLSSRVERKRAHKFYQRLGYEKIKTSYIFSKKLNEVKRSR